MKGEAAPGGHSLPSFGSVNAYGLDGPCAHDAKRVYFMAKMLGGTDPVTFVVADAKFQRARDAWNRCEQDKSVPASAGNP